MGRPKACANVLLKMNAIYPFSNGGAWVTNVVGCSFLLLRNRTGGQFLRLEGQAQLQVGAPQGPGPVGQVVGPGQAIDSHRVDRDGEGADPHPPPLPGQVGASARERQLSADRTIELMEATLGVARLQLAQVPDGSRSIQL